MLVEIAETVQTQRGDVVAGALVEVRDATDNSLATLYSTDAGASLLPNPVPTDEYGQINAYVDEGTYLLVIPGFPSIRFEAVSGRHNHDDRYYTEAETDGLLAAAAVHDHDDRYYTEAEVDAAIAAVPEFDPDTPLGYFTLRDSVTATDWRVTVEDNGDGTATLAVNPAP